MSATRRKLPWTLRAPKRYSAWCKVGVVWTVRLLHSQSHTLKTLGTFDYASLHHPAGQAVANFQVLLSRDLAQEVSPGTPNFDHLSHNPKSCLKASAKCVPCYQHCALRCSAFVVTCVLQYSRRSSCIIDASACGTRGTSGSSRSSAMCFLISVFLAATPTLSLCCAECVNVTADDPVTGRVM
eukprot:6458272-Amphidinium_carterae.2